VRPVHDRDPAIGGCAEGQIVDVVRQDVRWVCCQLGAREHFAVPRALHRAGKLAQLITDAWAPSWSRRSALGRLRQRYHADLEAAPVEALTSSLLGHEALWWLQGKRDWDHMIARNAWFQSSAARRLREAPGGGPTMVFAHSYAALAIFRQAKRFGWTRVLGQIDPGSEHYAIVDRLTKARPAFRSPAVIPPPAYFDDWREECGLADRIVVNSPWSREALIRAGVPEQKITIVALPYEPPAGAPSFTRTFPDRFSSERPLRALFVGTASVTKGVPELLEAVDMLQGLPVELRLVGERAFTVPDRLAAHARIHWVGPVDRDAVMEYYRSSDVLMFPSHSDGFGMAQVEAQAWGLPIIASRQCGPVVRDEENGFVVRDVSANTLAAALRRMIESPGLLARFSAHTRARPAATLVTLAEGLIALEPA
jgi:glycosyltransferase involved in cell wall biosynthesis